MAIDTTELKRNADWYYTNLDSLLPKYNGKYIGISDCSVVKEDTMPTISESKKGGIKIAVNYSDHNPPHFHVIKGKKTIALVSIRDAVVIEGVLPRVLLHRVLGWCVSHTKELLADWNLARQGKEPKWIDWTID